jgi:hypothetical protein
VQAKLNHEQISNHLHRADKPIADNDVGNVGTNNANNSSAS